MTNRITISSASGTWVVRAGGAVIAESAKALELKEGDYPSMIYFPRDDVAMAFLDATDHSTVCPYKGDASYFSIIAKSGPIENAVWSYEKPIEGIENIAGYLAFYPDRTTLEQV